MIGALLTLCWEITSMWRQGASHTGVCASASAVVGVCMCVERGTGQHVGLSIK